MIGIQRNAVLSLVAVGLLLPAIAFAQTPTPAKAAAKATKTAPAVTAGYVVIDLTADPKDPDATQIVSFSGRTASSDPTRIDCSKIDDSTYDNIGQLAELVRCASDPEGLLDKRAAAAAQIKALAGRFVKRGTPRLISTKGELIKVVVIDKALLFQTKEIKTAKGTVQPPPFLVRGPKPKVSFDEKTRDSQFVTDLKSLAQVVAGLTGKEAAVQGFEPDDIKTPSPILWAHVSVQTLKLKRATVTVSAESGKGQTVLANRSGLSEERLALVIEDWEAAQVKGVACTNGLPDEDKARSTPFAVLICRAQSPVVPELQVAAIASLGELGDQRAASVLSALAKNPPTNAVGQAAIAALAKLKAPAAPAAPAAATGAKVEGAEEPLKPKAELLSGPVEHWFLSADVPLNSVDALSFDKDTGQVSLGDEPSTFYIGINFLVGDIKETNRPFLQNLVFKAMVKASSHPLDSVGVAIGLRGQWFSKWGLNLDALTPFVGWTMTKEDAETDGTITRRAGHNSELRYGVSLNLDQAIKWVGGK